MHTMRTTLLALGALVMTCACAALSPAAAAPRFEVAAWVDHFDFAAVQEQGKYLFDTETAAGCRAILDHVQEVGTTTILWRNCAGSTMRYQTRVESTHQTAPLDKRRIPSNEPIYGWVRYGDTEPDILRYAMDESLRRGLRPGVHWPFEETHWINWTIGGWNFDHPQFWSASRDGQPWPGRCSLAYDEVVNHKLDLVGEMVDRGIQSLFIDLYRNGAWTPADDFVAPAVASWRKQYGTEPPADGRDPAWCRHVAGYVTQYLRKLRARLDASGRKIDLMLGVFDADPASDSVLISRGVDWQTWVREGLIDTLVINYVSFDSKDPWESTRKRCREVMALAKGHCRVLWPVRAYDFSGSGMPSYQKVTGLSQPQIAARLMEMAWEEGADGISLECVDYNNYGPETRKVMRELAEGKCKWVRGNGGGVG